MDARIWIGGALIVLAAAVVGVCAIAGRRAMIGAPPPEGHAMTSVYDFEARQIDGKPVPLSRFKGKVLLIVNTASKCGFTPQFEGLEALHEKYAAKGLAVLGFPSNQFGDQDPGTNEEIGAFCVRELRRQLSDDGEDRRQRRAPRRSTSG